MIISLSFYAACIGAMVTGILVTRNAFDHASTCALATLAVSILYLILTNH
jgi:hypothetical protein